MKVTRKMYTTEQIAIGESEISDICHAVRDNNSLNASTLWKCGRTNYSDAVGNIYFWQTGAVIKCMTSDPRYGIEESHIT